MPAFSLSDFSQFPPATLLALGAIMFVGGMVRGFSGFGTGLIVMPVASTVIDPKLAVTMLLIIDFTISAPMIPNAARQCQAETVLPAVLGAVLGVPLGAWVLINSDPLTLRWGIDLVVGTMIMLLLLGVRYTGKPKTSASLATGILSGFMGGAAQIPGPPIVTYWLAGPFPASIVRANLIMFFLAEATTSTATYALGGLFTRQAVTLTLILAPVFGLAMWIGTRLHPLAPEKTFRAIALILIALSGITGMPALDPFLRPTL